jgi:hypothetical protein
MGSLIVGAQCVARPARQQGPHRATGAIRVALLVSRSHLASAPSARARRLVKDYPCVKCPASSLGYDRATRHRIDRAGSSTPFPVGHLKVSNGQQVTRPMPPKCERVVRTMALDTRDESAETSAQKRSTWHPGQGVGTMS